MTEEPNYYHCHLDADMSMYDHLPYHINPELCDGTHITLHSGNIVKGYFVNYNYTDKRIIIPNDDIKDTTPNINKTSNQEVSTDTENSDKEDISIQNNIDEVDTEANFNDDEIYTETDDEE